PTESMATLESDSCRNVGATRNELLMPPRLTPALVNRAARMSVSPVESLRVQVTTKLPALSMATAGSESSVFDVLLMTISLPMGWPEELYRRALMSVSVPERKLVHTTTDRPLTPATDWLAVAAWSWFPDVVVLTPNSPKRESATRDSRLSKLR